MNTNKSFDNPFDGLYPYGRDKVQLYVFLHIMAMTAKKEDLQFLLDLINAIQPIYDDMFVNISDKTSDVKQRMVQTEAVETSLENFRIASRKVNSRIIDKLTSDSPIFKHNCPNHFIKQKSSNSIIFVVANTANTKELFYGYKDR